MLFFGKKIEKVLKVSNMKCAHCTAKVENALKSLSEVKNAKADIPSKTVKVTLKKEVDVAVLINAVTDAGFPAEAL